MATVDALLAWARSQLETVEKPPGSNHVHYWDDINMHGYQGQPWCAAFVLAGLDRVGVSPVSRSVYVPAIRNDYQRAGRLYGIEQALPGDQVFFSFGDHSSKTHTGIVVAIDPKARTVTSIDGNTSSALGGSDFNGGGVYKRTRPWSQTWGVGRPLFDPPVPTHPPNWAWEYQEAEVRTQLVLVGPLDTPKGRGFMDWNPGLGRDPVIVGFAKQGPDPSPGSGDSNAGDPYWEKQGAYDVKISPRGGVARVVVTGGQPGSTVGIYVSVA